MKLVEDAAIPILQPMIHGNYPFSLSQEAQKVLARWISLRAVIFNAYNAKNASEVFFSQEQRARFLDSGSALDNSMVIMATVQPSKRVNFESWVFRMRIVDGSPSAGILFLETTCLIRQVALQSIVCKGEWFVGHPINAEHDKPLQQIWPTGVTRKWPPEIPLTLAGYDSLKGLMSRQVIAHS